LYEIVQYAAKNAAIGLETIQAAKWVSGKKSPTLLIQINMLVILVFY